MQNTPSAPHLVDDLSKHYIQDILKKCNQTRTNMYITLFNLFVLFGLVLIGGIVLYVLYRNRPDKNQSYNKMIKDQEYVLSKIRFYQEQQKKISNASSLIDNLPSNPSNSYPSEKIGYDIRDNLAFNGHPLPVEMPPPITPHLYNT